MSQYARNHPEAYEEGVDWLDAHSDLADREKTVEAKEPNFCPYCGAPWDEKHNPGCRLFVAED